MNKVLIGKILKPKGLDGTLKITNFTLGELASSFKSVFIDGVKYPVLRSYCANEFVFIKADGINSIDDAEMFRQKEIYGLRDDLHLSEGQYLEEDLIGLSVFVGDRKIGEIESVENYGAGDIFVVAIARGTVMVPKTPSIVEGIDIDAGEIYFNEKEYNEVKV